MWVTNEKTHQTHEWERLMTLTNRLCQNLCRKCTMSHEPKDTYIMDTRVTNEKTHQTHERERRMTLTTRLCRNPCRKCTLVTNQKDTYMMDTWVTNERTHQTHGWERLMTMTTRLFRNLCRNSRAIFFFCAKCTLPYTHIHEKHTSYEREDTCDTWTRDTWVTNQKTHTWETYESRTRRHIRHTNKRHMSHEPKHTSMRDIRVTNEKTHPTHEQETHESRTKRHIHERHMSHEWKDTRETCDNADGSFHSWLMCLSFMSFLVRDSYERDLWQ